MNVVTQNISFITRFGPESFMHGLLDRGLVWMNAAGHFASLSGDAERADPDEALIRRYSQETARVTVGVQSRPGAPMPLSLAGPMRVWNQGDRARAVYSMYGVGHFHERIDPRCRELGQWVAVFTNGMEFVRRVRAAAAAVGHELAFKPVNYVPESHSGAMDIFTKTEGFRHQQEWRLVSRDPVPDGRLVLTVGPLHDVARLVSFDSLKFQ